MSLIPLEVSNGEFIKTKKWVMTHLGYPSLGNIALAEEHLNVAITDAITIYSKFATQQWDHVVIDYWQFETQAKKSVYELDSCIDPAKIKAVIYNPQNYSLFNIAFNQNYDFLFFSTNQMTPDLSTFYMALMKQEFVNTVLGQEGTWEIIGSPPKLHLMPMPQGHLPVAVLFSKLPDENTLDRIFEIRRLALAKAKIMLGEIYGRYSSIPGGQQDIQLNGDNLKTEGKEELEKLEENLWLSTPFLIRTDND